MVDITITLEGTRKDGGGIQWDVTRKGVDKWDDLISASAAILFIVWAQSNPERDDSSLPLFLVEKLVNTMRGLQDATYRLVEE